jgi:putative restriction endonuclease
VIDEDLDSRVRLRTFEFLTEQTEIHGSEILPWKVLAAGFDFEGTRVPLIGPQGIFKPALLDLPLSITTAAPSPRREQPYSDSLGEDGLLRYCYRGTDINHRDNAGLRVARDRQLPLVYFHGVVRGEYFARWPVFVVADHPETLQFKVAVDSADALALAPTSDAPVNPRRIYVTRETEQRLHQQRFRLQVLKAYSERCTVCRLHHKELLDAAHILPDKHPLGEPVVQNGLAMCKLHHAAFDRHLMGVSPDLTIHLREDIRSEPDGPMLEHGLKGFEGLGIHKPRRASFAPDRQFLEERFSIFLRAG